MMKCYMLHNISIILSTKYSIKNYEFLRHLQTKH